MRTEKTIRERLERLRASKTRRFQRHEIGALAWVLGEVTSAHAGAMLDTKDHQSKCPHDKSFAGYCTACGLDLPS
jgi:hypothetical protein